MTEERSAWLLDFGEDLRAVVGRQHLSEYLLKPQAVEIPLTPLYALGVLKWRDRLIPLLDLARLNGNHYVQFGSQNQVKGAIVLAYRESPAADIQYGALVLSSAPREIHVRDEMVRNMPGQPAFWRTIVSSCISFENQEVPILRVRSIFTSQL